MESKGIIFIIVLIVISIAFILIIREIVCWYWKINERIKLQKVTLETMLKIYEQNGGEVDWKEANKLIS